MTLRLCPSADLNRTGRLFRTHLPIALFVRARRVSMDALRIRGGALQPSQYGALQP